MKKIFFVLVLFAVSIVSASGGSVYSRYGAGNTYYYMSAGKLALGGPGIATTGRRNLDNMNPAGWASVNRTRIETGLNYNGILIEDYSNSAYYSNYNFAGFLFGVPVSEKYGITISGGLVPFTRVNYETVETSNISGENATSTYTGEGGLSKIYFGTSYNTNIGFTLGFSYEYYTGKIDYTSELEFNSGADLNGAKFTNRHNYHGSGITVGLLTEDLSSLLDYESVTDLRFGLMFNYVNTLGTDTTLITETVNGEDELTHGVTDSEIPYRVGTGIAFEFSNQYLVNIDYIYSPWSDYKYNNQAVGVLKNQSRFNVGVEYKNESTIYSSFWEQIIFRGGLSYENLKYTLNGNDLTELGVHAGLSIPMGVQNKIDIGLSYGFRGTTDSDLLKENVFNLAVTLSFGELWFVRQDR